MRWYEAATAAAVILIAAVAMFDSFGRSGWTATGPDAGWYPFWSSAFVVGASAWILFRLSGVPRHGRLFTSREGVFALVKLVAPMVALAALLPYAGLYVMSALYMAIFARFVGRYPWPWVVLIALAVPVALYFGFEQAFKSPLPKTVLYTQGILPF